MKEPKVIERFADNGGHSHYELIDIETHEVLWSEDTEALSQHNVSDMLLQKEAIDFVMWCKNNGEFVYQYECNRHYNEILYAKFKSNYR